MQTPASTLATPTDKSETGRKMRTVNLGTMSVKQLARFAKRQARRGNPDAVKAAQVLGQRLAKAPQIQAGRAITGTLRKLNQLNHGDSQRSAAMLREMLVRHQAEAAPEADPANVAGTYRLEKGEEITQPTEAAALQ